MIHRIAAWLAYRVNIARPLADMLRRRFRMSKYHARKSSPQSRDQHGNSRPYPVICPPGGASIVQVKAAPAGIFGEVSNKGGNSLPANRAVQVRFENAHEKCASTA